MSDLISGLADSTTSTVADPRGLEWRVRALTPSQAVRAGAGLPGFAKLQGAVSGAHSAPASAEQAAILRAQASDPNVVADTAEYQERVAMAAICGVRRVGEVDWSPVKLVAAGAEDAGRSRVSIAVLSPEVVAGAVSAALTRASAAAVEVARFRGEE